MSKHENCPACLDARTSGDLAAALHCKRCKGTGIRRAPTSFICNRCAGSLCPESAPTDPYGLVEARVGGGYSSPVLTDLYSYEFSLCEKCLRELFDGFKIPPATVCHMDGCDDYAEERAYYAKRVWREAGGMLEKLARGLCNATIECDRPAVWRQFCSGELTEAALCDDHRKGSRSANSYEVPLASVAGIPLRREDRTPEQKRRLAHVRVQVAAYPDAISYFEYAPSCVIDLVGRGPFAPTKGGSTGAMWFPGDNLPDWAGTLDLFPFEDGTLGVGPYFHVRAMSQEFGVREVSLMGPAWHEYVAREAAEEGGED